MTKKVHHEEKKRKQPVTLVAAPPAVDEASLSPYRAFVVQFREQSPAAPQHFAGRVEHMTSGHAARFYSPEELTAFLQRVLSNAGARGPGDH